MTAVYVAIVFLLAILACSIVLRWLERKRRKAFERLAQELGLRYVARDDSIGKECRFLDALRQEKAGFAFNVLQGSYKGYPVRAFDYHYQPPPVTESKERGLHDASFASFSILLLEQEGSFPELLIDPRGTVVWGSSVDLHQMLELAKVDFESVEFSKAFVVRSADRKFAYDVCHPRMMEYLLEHQDVSLEIEGSYLALSLPRRLAPWEIRRWLNRLVEIRGLFPEYLYRA